ncbi:MAG: metalloprotease TldD, partial [Alphaproteobacteria bacterium]|nr:metalloprotease TldD [Alphaproteobacteria bacterium]
MSDISATDELFYDRTGLNRTRVGTIVDDALHGADDGELYLEYRQSESLVFDDGRLKSAAFDTTQGFGLRAVAGEATGYSHSSELSEAAMKRAGSTVRAVLAGDGGTFADAPTGTNQSLYADDNPLGLVAFKDKVDLLAGINEYARASDEKVQQVMASLSGEWQAVQIIRPGGLRVADVRPLVRLNVSVVVGQGDRMESGSFGTGGRVTFERYLDPASWKSAVDGSTPQAIGNLLFRPGPPRGMPGELGPGSPGSSFDRAHGDAPRGAVKRHKT